MPSKNVNFYISVSSGQLGALGIFHLYGVEEALVQVLDIRIGAKKVEKKSIPLVDNELRYGWLRDETGEVIDEVMLARTRKGMRVLMTHGGHAVRTAMDRYFTMNEFSRFNLDSVDDTSSELARLEIDPLLAGCHTEAQAAAVLEARAEAEKRGQAMRLSAGLLATHRLLLAGPPNAGKSSLLNHLAGHTRAFVHHEAGATTDVVDELIDLGGYAVLVGDMPGYAGDREGLGREAWDKAAERIRFADATLFVIDSSQDWDEKTDAAAAEIARLIALEGGTRALVVVLNKSDLPLAVVGCPWECHFPGAPVLRVCSLPDGDGLDKLGRMGPILFGWE